MNLKAGTVRIPAMQQRKQGLEVSCHPWTFHTAIPPAQQLKQCFSIKDSLGCLALLFVVGWVVWGSRMRERKRPETLQVDQGMSKAYKQGSCEVPWSLKKSPLLQSFTSGRTEQGQPEWPFLPFFSAHSRPEEKEDSVLLTLALGPSGAMPQLIYLMLQPDFFFFFFLLAVQSVAALWLLGST